MKKCKEYIQFWCALEKMNKKNSSNEQKNGSNKQKIVQMSQ